MPHIETITFLPSLRALHKSLKRKNINGKSFPLPSEPSHVTPSPHRSRTLWRCLGITRVTDSNPAKARSTFHLSELPWRSRILTGGWVKDCAQVGTRGLRTTDQCQNIALIGMYKKTFLTVFICWIFFLFAVVCRCRNRNKIYVTFLLSWECR